MNSELQEILDHTQRMVFFGGAGVSTASGIPDFRSPTGLYSQKYAGLTPEMILSRSFFYLHPEIFFEFYRSAMLFPQARPNVVHTKLAALETTDRLRGIVTQNIDGLHREAGNIRVYEVHGSVHENVCMDCGERFSMQWMAESTGIPRCTACGGVVKPGVVLYGEAPDRYVMMGASREISEADTLIVAGTSLSVEPAASLIRRFRGRNMVVINREPVPGEENAGLVIHFLTSGSRPHCRSAQGKQSSGSGGTDHEYYRGLSVSRTQTCPSVRKRSVWFQGRAHGMDRWFSRAVACEI